MGNGAEKFIFETEQFLRLSIELGVIQGDGCPIAHLCGEHQVSLGVTLLNNSTVLSQVGVLG
jgi:hypothetical protein